MTSQSDTFILGTVGKNEAWHSDMIDIMSILHDYLGEEFPPNKKVLFNFSWPLYFSLSCFCSTSFINPWCAWAARVINEIPKSWGFIVDADSNSKHNVYTLIFTMRSADDILL